MENLTQTIEKLIKDLFKGPRGEQISRLYTAYWNPINFAIVFLIGAMLNFLFASIFHDLFGAIISNLTMLLWCWVMTVGPLGYVWGFGQPKSKQLKSTLAPNSQKWKKATKEIEYREVQPNTEQLKTSKGTVLASKDKDVIIRSETGEEVPVKKEDFKQLYEEEKT